MADVQSLARAAGAKPSASQQLALVVQCLPGAHWRKCRWASSLNSASLLHTPLAGQPRGRWQGRRRQGSPWASAVAGAAVVPAGRSTGSGDGAAPGRGAAYAVAVLAGVASLPACRRGSTRLLATAAGAGAPPVGLVQLALVLMYVLAQTSLNLYMKFLMSSVKVVPGLHGIPASFIVTGLQQLVAFGFFLAYIFLRRRANMQPTTTAQRVVGVKAWVLILVLAAAFAFNMSLNNFSLAFIPISVNQVIRACTPLATALLQLVVRPLDRVSRMEWLCMIIGVGCAVLTVVAKVEGHFASSGGFAFGTLLCAASIFCAAADLVLKQAMGRELRLNPVDAIGRMALPSFFLLLLPGLLCQHPLPVAWQQELGRGLAWTDAAVLLRGTMLRPELLGYIGLSGVLAFGYNAFTTFLAVRLSATTASIVGNLPASIVVSLLLLERELPRGAWGVLLWLGIVGNFAAFAAYSAAKRRRASRTA